MLPSRFDWWEYVTKGNLGAQAIVDAACSHSSIKKAAELTVIESLLRMTRGSGIKWEVIFSREMSPQVKHLEKTSHGDLSWS